MIFYDFASEEGQDRSSYLFRCQQFRIISAIFYRLLLFMGTWCKKLKLKQNSFHFFVHLKRIWRDFFYTRNKSKFHKKFHEGSKDVYICMREGVLLCAQNLGNKFAKGWCKNSNTYTKAALKVSNIYSNCIKLSMFS